MLAVRLSRKVAVKSYELIKHEEAPENPGNPEVNWSDALVFSAVTGLIAGLARMTALRILSNTMIPSEGDDMDEEIDEIA